MIARFITIFTLLLTLYSVGASAQNPFPTTESEFVEAFSDELRSSGNKFALQEDTLFVLNFSNTGSSTAKSFMALANAMKKKGARGFPQFTTLASVVNRAVSNGVSDASLAQALDVAKTSLQQDGMNTSINFLKDARTFFEHGLLFNGTQYKARVEGGNVSFTYHGAVASSSDEEDAAGISGGVVYDYEEYDSETDTYSEEYDEYDDYETYDPYSNQSNESKNGGLATVGFAPMYSAPSLQGPAIVLENADLVLETNSSTAVIEKTSGSLLSKSNTFVGNGGSINLAGSGIDLANATVIIDQYDFKINQPNITFTKTTLTYPEMFNGEVEGQFELMVPYNKPMLEVGYPKFTSFQNDVEVKGLKEDLALRGGFSFRGEVISSECMTGMPSELTIKQGGEVKAKFISHDITIEEDKVSSPEGSITLFTGNGEVYNNGIMLAYYRDKEKISLYTSRGNRKNSTYLLPYFEMEVSAQQLSWKFGEGKMYFFTYQGTSLVPVIFESVDYFSEERFRNATGTLKFNPLRSLSYISKKEGKDEFSTMELSGYTPGKPEDWEYVLPSLNAYRFVDYDPYLKMVKVLPKLKEWDMATMNARDYDKLMVVSIDPPKGTSNSTYHIDSGFIDVRGVRQIIMSDSNNVVITPKDSSIKIYADRELLFNGKLNTGIYAFDGDKFRFNYKDYKVTMDQIDSLTFPATDDKLEQGSNKEMAGTVYINDPNNKSENKNRPDYPKLDVKTTAYKYFDDKRIRNGTYDRDFYFQTDPFNLDSVSSNDPNAAAFSGSFHSDSILPTFREVLKLQPDGSLGFIKEAPTEGWPLYGNEEARFFGTLSLNYKGLVGDGKITYRSAAFESDSFVFHQDSIKTFGPSFEMQPGDFKGVSYPAVSLQNYKLHWIPYSDSIVVMNEIDNPFQLYDNSATLEGFLVVSSKGTYGDGLIQTRGAKILSSNYNFKEKSFSGRESYFEIQSDNVMKAAFLSKNVHFDFDLIAKEAVFRPEVEGYASNEFPYTQYKTSIPEAVWKLDEQMVTMTKPEEADIRTSYFYSTHPDQDSLVFNAGKAEYDLRTYTLIIEDIPYIPVADNHIIPDSNKVRVFQNADMELLTKAKIISDGYNQFHHFADADLYINSRHNFEGAALYQFRNEVGDTVPIPIDSFAFEEGRVGDRGKGWITSAGSQITEFDELEIAPGIIFKGLVTMESDKEGLVFDGFVRLAVQATYDATWLPYYNDGRKKEFRMNMKNAVTAEGKPLYNGLHMDFQNKVPYLTFVGEKFNPLNDWDIFSTTGELFYSKYQRQYIIGDKSRVNGESLDGNMMTYSDSTLQATMSGEFTFTNPDDRNISIPGYGKVVSNFMGDSLAFTGMLDWQINLPSKAWSDMATTMSIGAQDAILPEIVYDYPDILLQLGSAANDAQARVYEEESMNGYVPLNTITNRLKGIVFSKADLKWSNDMASFYTKGKLGLSHAGRTDVNAMVDVIMTISQTYEGEEFNLFIEVTPEYWFYFNYRKDLETQAMMLKTTSSIIQYNQTIKEKYRPEMAKPGAYVVAPADGIDRDYWLESFHKDFLGDETYKAPAISLVNMPGAELATDGGQLNEDGSYDQSGGDDGWNDNGWNDGGGDDWNSGEGDQEEKPAQEDQPAGNGWDTGGNDDGWDNSGGGWDSGGDDGWGDSNKKKKDKPKEKDKPTQEEQPADDGWDTGGNDDGWDNSGGAWDSGGDDGWGDSNKKKKDKPKEKDKPKKEEKPADDGWDTDGNDDGWDNSGGGWDSGGDDGWDSAPAQEPEPKKKKPKKEEKPANDGWDTGGNDDGWDSGADDSWDSAPAQEPEPKKEMPKKEEKPANNGWDTGGNDDGWDSGADDSWDSAPAQEPEPKKEMPKKEEPKKEEPKKEEPKKEEKPANDGWDTGGSDDGWDSGGGGW